MPNTGSERSETSLSRSRKVGQKNYFPSRNIFEKLGTQTCSKLKSDPCNRLKTVENTRLKPQIETKNFGNWSILSLTEK